VILGALYAALAYYVSVTAYNWYYSPSRRMRLVMVSILTRLHLAS